MFLIVNCRHNPNDNPAGFILIDLRESEISALYGRCEEANTFVMETLWVRHMEIEPLAQTEVIFYPVSQEEAPVPGRGWAVIEQLPQVPEEIHRARRLVGGMTLRVFNDHAQLYGRVVINDGEKVFNLSSANFPFKVFGDEREASDIELNISANSLPDRAGEE